MTFPTYEEWGKKVAEQVIDIYLINGRTIREWIEILSDELTMLDKIRAEIEQYGSIWVEYVIKGHTDRDIELLIEDVLRQAKEQVLEVIDRYTQEGEVEE